MSFSVFPRREEFGSFSYSVTSSFSQRKHSGRKGHRKTFYEGIDVVAKLLLFVLFHLPEDGGWKQSVDGTVNYRFYRDVVAHFLHTLAWL